MKPYIFDRITIIGLGLIGSSIARAVRERQIAATIVGCDRNDISLAYGRKHGFLDIATSSAKEAVEGSNLVILATPPSTLEDIMLDIAPALSEGTIVMDVSSVKQPAIAAITPHLPEGVYFIPAHPIAGSEHSGISAGRADLFDRKRIVVTPEDPHSLEPLLHTVTNFWKAMGAKIEAMPAHLHDLIYAYVSHLPQLLAFAAASLLEPFEEEAKTDETLQKFLRISHSNPELWTDIFLLNKENIVKALDRYLDAVAHIITELSEPPEGEIPLADENLSRTALFPRVAASCLITTVMEAEKKAGFPFARYAGTGFADFTFPASQSPEGDIESISNQYQAVTTVLAEYVDRLKAFKAAIDSGDAEKIITPL